MRAKKRGWLVYWARASTSSNRKPSAASGRSGRPDRAGRGRATTRGRAPAPAACRRAPRSAPPGGRSRRTRAGAAPPGSRLRCSGPGTPRQYGHARRRDAGLRAAPVAGDGPGPGAGARRRRRRGAGDRRVPVRLARLDGARSVDRPAARAGARAGRRDRRGRARGARLRGRRPRDGAVLLRLRQLRLVPPGGDAAVRARPPARLHDVGLVRGARRASRARISTSCGCRRSSASSTRPRWAAAS